MVLTEVTNRKDSVSVTYDFNAYLNEKKNIFVKDRGKKFFDGVRGFATV